MPLVLLLVAGIAWLPCGSWPAIADSAPSRAGARGSGAAAGGTPDIAGRGSTVVEGWLTVSWGDPPAGSGLGPRRELLLTGRDGRQWKLDLEGSAVRDAGWLRDLDRAYVRVTVAEDPDTADTLRPSDLRRATPADPPQAAPATLAPASRPFVSIPCRFSDVGSEPANLAYFLGMYGSAPGRLDHYWREVSYDAIDVLGSSAVDWVELPHPRSYYVPAGGSANRIALFDDCTAAADPYVDFSLYHGINLMFNEVLDCCAWGGSRYATLDGVTRAWPATWQPPWGYGNVSLVAHEMGHAFGLPHSDNQDGDGDPYDNPWDVMSDVWGHTRWDAVYGYLGKHSVAYQKQRLGWLAAQDVLDVLQAETFTLDRIELAVATNPRLARVPLSDGRYYTIEARAPVGHYDANLPGSAVIIHEVDETRATPARVVDDDSPPADYSDTEGVMWRVGETFEDAAQEIQISVLSEGPTGFEVAVQRPPMPFCDLRTRPSPAPGGTTEGDGAFPCGSVQTVGATPAQPGWRFVDWTDGAVPVSTVPSFEVQLTGDRDLVANFTDSWLELTAPDASAEWGVHTTQTITWNAGAGVGPGGSLALSFSYRGQQWTLGSALPGQGSLEWTVPDTPARNAVVHVGWLDGGEWQALASSAPFSIVGHDDVLLDFGDAGGLWSRYNGTVWRQLDPRGARSVVVANLDDDPRAELVADFGPEDGLWIYRNDESWEPLHPLPAVHMAVGSIDDVREPWDDSPGNDLIVDFGPGAGIWIYANGATWSRLHALSSHGIVTGDLNGNGRDEIVVDFGPGLGVWVRYDDASWARLHALSTVHMAAGNLNSDLLRDELVLDFGPEIGIWSYENGQTWRRLHVLGAHSLAIGQVEGASYGDLIVDFGPGLGIWLGESKVHSTWWHKLHASSAESLCIANLDSDETDDLVVDFGAAGVWTMTGGTWSKLHPTSPLALAAANLDAQ